MIGRLAAAGLLLLAAVAPASADPDSEALVRGFIAWVDSSNEWNASVSVVRSDGADTFAEGVVLSREQPHVSISIETLRMQDLIERDGGGFTASEIEMAGAAAATDVVQVAIPSAAIANISLPSVEGTTLDV